MAKYKCRLKIVLIEQGIKMGEFAEKVAIDRSTLSLLVNDRSLPSFDTLYAIMRELNKVDGSLRIEDVWVVRE